ncbi:MAG TPA: TnsD family Tn7-like transposition protein [Burkholderiaceae bacterium]|jgi:transposase
MSMDTVDPTIGERIPWLPDETLFSWCSRYHLLAANGLASATCMQLFGRRRLGLAHDFPAGIAALALRAGGSLGMPEDIVRERTVLAFYAPFRPAPMMERATRKMLGEGIGSLKYELGLLTSGLGAAHPLKACPACMADDHQRFKVAYWRRSHQLPGVWICPAHGDALRVSTLKLDQKARFQWGLPGQAYLLPWTDLAIYRDFKETSALAHKMAKLSGSICALTQGRVMNPGRIANAFRRGLEDRGWLGAATRVRWGVMRHELSRHAAALAGLPPFAMQADGRIAQSQLSRIMSARSLTHPLRYLAWISLLFDSLSEFLTAYDGTSMQAVQTAKASRKMGPSAMTSMDARAAEAVQALLLGQESATAIALRMGVTPSTVAAWAAKAGLQTPRRPKSLDEPTWRAAVEFLASGQSKSNVAARIGISEVSVTRILRSVPRLQSQWHEVRFAAARNNAREAWIAVSNAAQILGIAAARRAEPGAYAWLYRNDRAWLRAQCARLDEAPRCGNHAVTRRLRADERYARLLISAAAELGGLGAPEPLRPESWTVVAPGLKRVLKFPDAWPLTIAALHWVLVARTERNPSGRL